VSAISDTILFPISRSVSLCQRQLLRRQCAEQKVARRKDSEERKERSEEEGKIGRKDRKRKERSEEEGKIGRKDRAEKEKKEKKP
jgi:hypothetical protein